MMEVSKETEGQQRLKALFHINERAIKQKYGFVSNPNLSLRYNLIQAIYHGTHSYLYASMPNNMAFHNLCQTHRPPEGVKNLLGLGLKYCIETIKPNPTVQANVQQLRNSIRLKAMVDNIPDSKMENAFEPALYVKSNYQARRCDADLENKIASSSQGK